MQTRFDTKSAVRSVIVDVYVPSVIPIQATQIENWANHIRTRQELPALLRTLIHSTGTNLSRVDFPAFDNAERRGWDGTVEARKGTSWIPEGKSGWELSTTDTPQRKASEDYGKRTRLAPRSERKNLTFIFVTARNWSEKKTWEEEKNNRGEWKSVKAYDASDLEQWIEISVPAQLWLAERLGLITEGLRSLHQCWSEWASVCDPQLSPQLFETAIRSNANTLARWFDKKPDHPFIIAADSQDEALAFLACPIWQQTDCASLLHRAVVLDTPTTLRKLASATESSLILVTNCQEIEKRFGSFHQRFHCIVIQPRNSVMAKPDIVLEPLLRFEDFKQALKAMGKSQHEVERLNRETSRSLTILRRRLATMPSIREPAWASKPRVVRKLIPAILAGAWHAESWTDCQFVAMLAQSEDYERDIADLLNLDASPLWSVGQYRGVISRIDSLFAISSFIIQNDLDKLFFIAEHLLLGQSAVLELLENRLRIALPYEKVRAPSGTLRYNIGETLILLSVFGNHLFSQRLGVNVEERVGCLIRKLLKPFTLDNLLLHKDDLPAYAEASPQVFLAVIEEDLLKAKPVSLELMQPTDSSLVGNPVRVSLLRALDVLAWRCENLPRVVNILARLACCRIEDNLADKPERSLQSILCSWLPQTAAPVDQRIQALETIVRQFPDIGWKLCMGELDPKSMLIYSRRPRWRDDAAGVDIRTTETDRIRFLRKVIDLALSWPHHSYNTLRDLWRRFEHLPGSDQATLCNLIVDWAKTANDVDRTALWQHIRLMYQSKLNDKRVRWALKELSPQDSVTRHVWLFKEHLLNLPEFREEELDYSECERRIHSMREKALNEILDERGIEGIRALLASAQIEVDGNTVGYVIKPLLNSVNTLKLALDCLHMETEGVTSAYAACLRTLLWKANADLLADLFNETENNSAKRLHLLLCMPVHDSTWQRVAAESPALQEKYWQNISFPFVMDLTDTAMHEWLDRLLGARRPAYALLSVEARIRRVETSRLQRILWELQIPNSEGLRISTFDISTVLEELDTRPDITMEEKVKIEFKYWNCLVRSERGVPNLECEVTSSPEAYTAVIALAFTHQDGKEKFLEWHAVDSRQCKNLAYTALDFLNRISRIPGTNHEGFIDVGKLQNWLVRTRELCARQGRSEVGDNMIGCLLSHAPKDDNGDWPCHPVCEAMERISSLNIGKGFIIGVHNSSHGTPQFRGKGGGWERDLASQYHSLSHRLAYNYPYVSRLLRDIANSYENTAKFWDTTDAVEERLYDML